MLKIYTIFLLLLQLLANTELCQLLKMPLLSQHYTEHVLVNKDISFIAFLNMHYFNGDPVDADFEADMQLPFKTPSGTLLMNQSQSVPVPQAGILLTHPVAETQSALEKPCLQWVAAVNSRNIFQPPKRA